MSIIAIEAAIATPAPSHTAKLVMLVLAHHHNAATGRCFPSHERIASEASLHKTSVIKAIKELEGATLITKAKGRRAGRKNAPNAYKLIFLTQSTLVEKVRHKGYARDGSAALPEQGTPTSPLRSEVGGAKKPKKRNQTRAPRRRMVLGWRPSPELLKKCRQLVVERGCTEADLERFIIDFVDYYIARGEVSAAWGLDFSRWVRRQLDFKDREDAREQNRANTGPGTGGRGDERQDALRRLYASTDQGGGGGG